MGKRKAIIIAVSAIVIIGVVLFYFFHPHSYSLIEGKTATCTEDGYEIYRCWCGNEYRTEQKQLGHKYKSSVEEPTCTDAGKTIYICEVCGDSYDELIKTIGHDYEESTKEPTCTESGEKEFKCKNCGDTYAEPIEALGHEYKDGVCVRCGETDPFAKSVQNETKATASAQTSVAQQNNNSVKTNNPNPNIDPVYGSASDADWAAMGVTELDPSVVDAPVYDPYDLHFE